MLKSIKIIFILMMVIIIYIYLKNGSTFLTNLMKNVLAIEFEELLKRVPKKELKKMNLKLFLLIKTLNLLHLKDALDKNDQLLTSLIS